MLNLPEWRGDDTLELGSMTFTAQSRDYSVRTTEERIALLKGRPLLKFYSSLFAAEPPKRVFEVGMFEGGSMLLFAGMMPDLRISGIDIRAEPVALRHWAAPFGDRVNFHYGVSQDDGAAIRRFVAEDFHGEQLDLVIDDASHAYRLTKASFDICFPLLRPGGKYIIEDWGWGHWPNWPADQWRELPLLSNLGYELVAACANNEAVISRVEFDARTITVTRGPAPMPVGGLSAMWTAQGRKFEPI